MLARLAAREPVTVVDPPAPHRVGDFLVRAASATGRSTAAAAGRSTAAAAGEVRCGGSDTFGVAAACVISAGWRWARTWHPGLYWVGTWPENPAEVWARIELRAGAAVNRAALLHAERSRHRRWTTADEATLVRAWQYSDRLQARALELWLSERVQVVVGMTGIALAVAVHEEGEMRFAPYLA